MYMYISIKYKYRYSIFNISNFSDSTPTLGGLVLDNSRLEYLRDYVKNKHSSVYTLISRKRGMILTDMYFG